MEAQQRKKGYPLQQSHNTDWTAFVSALAQLFRDSAAITQLLFKHIQPHTITMIRQRCAQTLHLTS